MERHKMRHYLIRFLRLVPRYIVLLFGLLVVAGPVVWIVLGSLKPEEVVLVARGQWQPSKWMWSNYLNAWRALDFPRYTLNSVVMTVSIIVGHLTLASLAGYGFAKFKFPGQKALFLFVLGTMMLPVQVTMVPLFVIMKTFGWVDTYQGLIVPLLVNAFGVFFMRQYMLSIPDDLIDAARIDGASELQIFLRIVLPLSTSALAGLGLLVGMGAWGEFLWPVIISQTEKLVTLPLGLSYFQRFYGGTCPFRWILAMSVVVTIPPLIAFLLAQRQLVESGALTGMK